MTARRQAPQKDDIFSLSLPFPAELRRRGDHWWLDAGGTEIRLSNLDKIFWPADGITKGDLIAYYLNVAAVILPHLRDRPLTMKRMPDGLSGGHFYQKDAPEHTPEWVPRCAVVTEEGEIDQMLMAQEAVHLLFIANLGCIEFHPLYSRCGSYDRPDYMVFDLDPFAPADFSDALAVARHVKAALDVLQLRGYAKTSGATGLQVYVPVDRRHGYEETRELAGRIGRLILEADPERVTMDWSVSSRKGKVFIDHNMNRRGASLASAYSVRPEPGGTVSTPLTWEEVEEAKVRPAMFTMTSILERLAGLPDIFLPVVSDGQDLCGALETMGVQTQRSPDDD